MTHLGTFDGVNAHRAVAYRNARQPQRSLAHAVISGAVMAAFLLAATVWLGSL